MATKAGGARCRSGSFGCVLQPGSSTDVVSFVGGSEPTAVRFSGQQAATAQQLSHGAAATLVLTQLSMLQHQTPEQSPESRERLLLLHRDLRRNPWGAPLRGVVWDCDPAPATEADLLKVRHSCPAPHTRTHRERHT